MKQAKNKIEYDFTFLMFRMYIRAKGRCHDGAFMLHKALEKLGYDVKLKHGAYIYQDKKIQHSWVEYKGNILETDTYQLGINKRDYERFRIIKDKAIKKRYKEMSIDFDLNINTKQLQKVMEYVEVVKNANSRL